MNVQTALDTLRQAWANDPDFRYTYQSNIAMAVSDALYWQQRKTGKRYLSHADIHAATNVGADEFLKRLEGK